LLFHVGSPLSILLVFKSLHHSDEGI
jgi:hypothetical protein